MAPLVAVLAAGLATRFGGGKLDAECAGKPLGSWVIETVKGAGLVPGVIITGPTAPAFAAIATGWELIANPDPAAGLGSSLALAASHAHAAGRDLLVVLADMPLIQPAHLCALIDANGVSATQHADGMLGVPAYFPLASLGPLLRAGGKRGAAHFLRQCQDLTIIEPARETLLDVDCREDLATVRQILARH